MSEFILYPQTNGKSILVNKDGYQLSLDDFLDKLAKDIGPDKSLGELAKSLGIIGAQDTELYSYYNIGGLTTQQNIFNMKPAAVLLNMFKK